MGPSFQWNLLNYGRLANNVWLQDAMFRELVVAYQQTVLLAGEEVENGLIAFLRSQQRVQALDKSVASARAAAETVLKQYSEGLVDFNRVALIQQDLVVREDSAGSGPGPDCHGLDPSLSGVGRRLGNPHAARRLVEAAEPSHPTHAGELSCPAVLPPRPAEAL